MQLTDILTSKTLKTTDIFVEALKTMNIHTVQDLLLYLPRSHEDLSEVTTLLSAPLGVKVTLRGTIDNLKLVRLKGGKRVLVQAEFIDEEGEKAQVVWFNQAHVMRMLTNGQNVALSGKVVENGYKLQLQSPTFEKGDRTQLLHAGRIVAVYPQTETINTKWLREKMALVKDAITQLRETLPEEVIADEKLLSRSDTIAELHFPSTPERLQLAKDRMAFEEMYRIQSQALERKRQWQGEKQKRLSIPMDIELIKAFFASLKFTPTGGQKVAIYEILKDMEREVPMSRLLEGDVGSGKTLVAVAVIANTIRSGGQAALMVPTEVLAKQHAVSIATLLVKLHAYLQTGSHASIDWETTGEKAKSQLLITNKSAPSRARLNEEKIDFRLPSIALLTGSTPKSEADDIRSRLASGLIDLVIGTHSLIESGVQFKDLKLAIVDEQHRFGVMQRQKLKDKGNPHFLAMTATPIPRTLALTAFGDHDLSVLMEKPGNRRVIQTKVVSPEGRRTVELFIDNQIAAGRQVFVICPLISDSKADEMLEVKSVEAELKRLTKAFSHRKIISLHGKMTPAEKDDIMLRFKSREYDILVSTSVIEVGIDVPNTTIMIIEGAERFGLAQLHQFRGRVGRGEYQSYCFLCTTTPQQSHSQRLKAMEEHDSGFMLAEIDLKIRGPGEMYGLRQSGVPEMKFGSLLNIDLVVRARKAAEKMLAAS
ncbi:MAG: ATP-dependent DNA helicase RecG [Candidatus Peribacteraceae bacterium]|nr:ATP-dependent DNA helicase RecG [Candidatus Peribacteraceae bacterium]